jgi:hypothetical protein
MSGAVMVEVVPAAQGWAVRSPALANDMLFAGGAAAEAAARRLAERLAGAGRPVRLIVRMRNGSVAGRFAYPAADAVLEPA